MEKLIETINQLQDVFTVTGSHDLDLPQIVVVGSQSSGKSSVLEHLVGESFLPRGSGVVTRCPLVLQLVHAEGNVAVEQYAIFQHNKNKIFTDYNLISKEIEEQTDRLAGGNKGICHTPINLKIFSSSFLNLTMVDLPGLTKVPVGDQPEDIEDQTKDLILKFVENPNCIILAVIPANVDMANSESLKIAREVDPEGIRTLAVLTKLDLMDEGTDAIDMLSGKVIPVKMGIIGVVNRSQKDIVDGKSIKQSLKDEADFFHSKYKSIASFHGSHYLTKTVQTILINHIKNCLPTLRESVSEKLLRKREELEILGDNKMDPPTLLLDLMTKYSISYCSAIKGNSYNIQTSELFGGARMKYVFQESLPTALRSIDALVGLSKTDILTAVQNASGASPTLFVPEVAFQLLVKRQLKKLRGPCLKCVDLIHDELFKIGQNCIDDPDIGLYRFPKLQREICKVVTDLLRSRLPITNQMVDSFIDIQMAYINTAHPDFLLNCVPELSFGVVGTDLKNDYTDRKNHFTMFLPSKDTSSATNQSKCQSRGQNHSGDNGSEDCTLIEELLRSYFSIVIKTVLDIVPKVIMHFVVNYVMDHLQSELVARLFKSGDSDLLAESSAVTEKRKELTTSILALERADTILNTLKPCPFVAKPCIPQGLYIPII